MSKFFGEDAEVGTEEIVSSVNQVRGYRPLGNYEIFISHWDGNGYPKATLTESAEVFMAPWGYPLGIIDNQVFWPQECHKSSRWNGTKGQVYFYIGGPWSGEMVPPFSKVYGW